MNIHRRASPQESYQSAAALFLREIQEGAKNIALCGGRSITPFLSEVFQSRQQVSLEQWRTVNFFLVDERLVPADHEESNARLIREAFFSVRGAVVNPEQLRALHCAQIGDESGVPLYVQELERCGGRFDLVVVSAGEDGHIAGLFPNHHSFRHTGSSFFSFHDSPKPPPSRMTASGEAILNAPCVIALVVGQAKAVALKRCSDPTVSAEECPLKLLEQVQRGEIFTDLIS